MSFLLFIPFLLLSFITPPAQSQPLTLDIHKERPNKAKFVELLKWNRESRREGRFLFGKEGKFVSSVFPGDYFVADVSLGTPPQQFSLEVTTDLPAMCVISKAYPNVTKFNNKYDPDASSTSKPNNMSFFAEYELGTLLGNSTLDVLSVAGYTYNNQSFGAISQAERIDGVLPTDGIFGLGWHSKTDEANLLFWDPPIEHLSQEWDHKLFSIYVSPYVGEHINKGVITFNGVDTTNCGNFSYVPFVDTSTDKGGFITRVFLVEGFTMSKYERRFSKALQSVYALGMTITLTPPNVYQTILRYTEAQYDFDSGLYMIKCNEASKKPEMKWTIGGKQWGVPASNYIADVGLNNGYCVMAVDQYPEFFSTDALILGDSFSQSFCASFDFQNSLFGLAPVKGN